ncbi:MULTISPECIES: hypothetical protein [unclassified Streptomyces]|uniref:hypothetical protein n=1 Tax=unclassified Streptomyces TaxID=2593676 RepID=UPI002E17B3D7|nr:MULTISPECIES: hypothetical protein [unclassified Streptomyces]
MASMIGFVVLVIAHLAGTVHASTPAGRHLDVAVTVCGHEAPQSLQQAATQLPAHHHSTADGHIEHLTDRPRVTGPAVPSSPGPDVPPLAPAAAILLVGSPRLVLGPPDGAHASNGAAVRSLLCVWRQ